MRPGVRTRVIAYLALALLVAGSFSVLELRSVPSRVERLVRRLEHPNARVAANAWHELSHLYYTEWAAVDPVFAHATDEAPVFFQVAPQPDPDQSELHAYYPSGHAWFYRPPQGVERRLVRSVGDAICALLYNARKESGGPIWKRDYAGDWRAWWSANHGHYGAP